MKDSIIQARADQALKDQKQSDIWFSHYVQIKLIFKIQF